MCGGRLKNKKIIIKIDFINGRKRVSTRNLISTKYLHCQKCGCQTFQLTRKKKKKYNFHSCRRQWEM